MKKEERICRHAQISEKALERKLVTKMKEKGCLAVKMNDVNNSGLPDRLVLLPTGKALFVEMKSQGARPTPLQNSRIRELRRMGFTVYVIDSEELLSEFMQYIELMLL